MNCLVIKNDGIGDLVLASGLIAALGERFGGNVDLVTCAANREVAEGIDPLHKRFYVSRDGLHFSARAWALGYLWPRIPAEDVPVLKAIRTQRYDLAICLRRFIRQSSLVLMRAVRAERKLCMWQLPTNASREQALRASKGWKHYDGPTDTVSELSYAQTFLRSELGHDFNATPQLNFCRRQKVVPGTKKVVLGISGSSTNWPSGNWIELAMLLAEAGWLLVLVGSTEMRELSEQIVRKVPAAENQVGRLSLAATAELLESCDAYVGNDTGLSHVASLVVLKCLVVLGGGTFRRFFPWPLGGNQTVVYHGLECFDCDWTCKFDERYCLELVRPRNVLNVFEGMMATTVGGVREVDLNPAKGNTYEPGWRRGRSDRRLPFHVTSGDATQ
jgi:ADP-heptose:LPS heptosyltransferase